MKDILIIANWKSNKTINEARNWLDEFNISDVNLNNKEVIVCPPFTLLGFLKKEIEQRGLLVKLGAQDISPFEEGAHTGDINGKQIKEFAEYVLVGHSERRSKYSESDEMLLRKVEMAKRYGLEPLFFTPNETSPIPESVKTIVYEPPFSISTSPNPTIESPEDVNEVAKKIKENGEGVQCVLYGGSVTPQNVNSFVSMENIDGVLVGGESLDASSFLQIVQNA